MAGFYPSWGLQEYNVITVCCWSLFWGHLVMVPDGRLTLEVQGGLDISIVRVSCPCTTHGNLCWKGTTYRSAWVRLRACVGFNPCDHVPLLCCSKTLGCVICTLIGGWWGKLIVHVDWWCFCKRYWINLHTVYMLLSKFGSCECVCKRKLAYQDSTYLLPTTWGSPRRCMIDGSLVCQTGLTKQCWPVLTFKSVNLTESERYKVDRS